MFTFKKQKDRWNQILRERKYRPSFFGLTVHFDWKVLLVVFLLSLISITIFSFNFNSKISTALQKDFSDEVETEAVDKIEIEKFDKILRRVESN